MSKKNEITCYLIIFHKKNKKIKKIFLITAERPLIYNRTINDKKEEKTQRVGRTCISTPARSWSTDGIISAY